MEASYRDVKGIRFQRVTRYRIRYEELDNKGFVIVSETTCQTKKTKPQ